MYDNLSNRLRGEAEVSNALPYIKELMRQAADSLDVLYHAVQALANTTDATTIATNADRIRSMTDEELAELIAYNTSCETCEVRKSTSGECECHRSNCGNAWLDWLKQECADG